MNHYGGPRRRSAAQKILGLMVLENVRQTIKCSVGRDALIAPGKRKLNAAILTQPETYL